jgi:hypothetical protein
MCKTFLSFFSPIRFLFIIHWLNILTEIKKKWYMIYKITQKGQIFSPSGQKEQKKKKSVAPVQILT